MNERILFLLANDKSIKRNDNKPCARAFVPRCEHTGVADPKYFYFYVDN